MRTTMLLLSLNILFGGCSATNEFSSPKVPRSDSEPNWCQEILPRFTSFVEANKGPMGFRNVIQEFYSARTNKGVDELLTEDATGQKDWNYIHELYLLFPRHRQKVHSESASCINVTNSVVVLVSGFSFSHIESLVYIKENGRWVIDAVFEGEAFETNLPGKN